MGSVAWVGWGVRVAASRRPRVAFVSCTPPSPSPLSRVVTARGVCVGGGKRASCVRQAILCRSRVCV